MRRLKKIREKKRNRARENDEKEGWEEMKKGESVGGKRWKFSLPRRSVGVSLNDYRANKQADAEVNGGINLNYRTLQKTLSFFLLRAD